jgi:large subunit ribosomal protein L24
MQRIRKGDTVTVLTGKDKGRSGEVIRVIPATNRVLIQGVNMVKRHAKPQMGDPYRVPFVGRWPQGALC